MRIYLRNYEAADWQGLFADAKTDMARESRYQHEAAWRLLEFALPENILQNGLVYGPTGKPSLRDYPAIHFNLSHTSGLVACVVGDQPVGIDVESIRAVPPAILRKLSDGERAYIESLKDWEEAFMRVWTMKEAWMKMTGEGLAAFEKQECIPGKPLPMAGYRQFIWNSCRNDSNQRYVITAAAMQS